MRVIDVTGVQTFALPILLPFPLLETRASDQRALALEALVCQVRDVNYRRRALELVDGDLIGRDQAYLGSHEIGRASCRERVSLSVVAASFKKNQRLLTPP